MELSSQAVILNAMDFGEADRLVTFFTDEYGKQRGVAKNAKRSNRRFGGGLEPGTIGRVRFFERPHVELVRIEDISVEYPAWKLTGSLKRILTLHVSLEMADKMLPLAYASHDKFLLITRWINFLGDNDPSPSHRHAFYYRWLAASGVAPVLDRCVVCGKKESSEWKLCSSQGGIVCKDCRTFPASLTVSNDMIRYLNGFKMGKIVAGEYKEAEEIFEYLIAHAVGFELKSFAVARGLLC